MMSVLFMQADNSDPWSFFTAPGSNAKGVLLVIGIVIVVALVFFGWAAYVRTPRKSHRHYHSDEHESRRRRKSRSSGGSGHKHHRRRRSSHRERPLNPTLSQIGGLPPPRDPQNPPH